MTRDNSEPSQAYRTNI